MSKACERAYIVQCSGPIINETLMHGPNDDLNNLMTKINYLRLLFLCRFYLILFYQQKQFSKYNYLDGNIEICMYEKCSHFLIILS